MKSNTQDISGGSNDALYRETRQATGSYVVRVVIAPAEFAPMLPHLPGYPGGSIPTAIRMRFSRHGGIYLVRCGLKTKPRGGSRAASRRSAPNPGSRTRREGRAPSHRPQMSSGRLILDRVARQQCITRPLDPFKKRAVLVKTGRNGFRALGRLGSPRAAAS